MTLKVYKYSDQLQLGQRAEQDFINVIKESQGVVLIKNNSTNKFAPDYIFNGDSTLELKTDFTTLTGTFFFERYSNLELKTDGGPWQSDKKHADYFAYWFKKTNEYYIFETPTLVNFLNEYISKNNLKLKNVMNTDKITAGYSVPVTALTKIVMGNK